MSAEPTEHVDPAIEGVTESRLLLCEHFPAGMTLAAAAVGDAAAPGAEEVQGASTLLSLPLSAAAVSGVLKEGVGSSHTADDPGFADEEAAPACACAAAVPKRLGISSTTWRTQEVDSSIPAAAAKAGLTCAGMPATGSRKGPAALLVLACISRECCTTCCCCCCSCTCACCTSP